MSHSPARAGLREWTGLAVLVLPTLLVSIDVSVMLLALPRISETFHADAAQQLWIMDIYGFLLAGFLITMGNLGDRIGRRKLVMIGGAAFALASALVAFSPSAPVLIGARALLGVAGATLTPSMLALISNMFKDERQRGLAISVWFSCFMGGMLVGPLVGGLLIEHFWWGAPFLLGVPVMGLMLLLAPRFVPEYRHEGAGPIDLLSVVLSLGAILPMVFGLKEFARGDFSTLSVGAVVAGLAFTFAFFRRQASLTQPLIDLKLFTNRAFTAVIAAMFLMTATGAFMVFMAQYFQLVAGLTPAVAGLCTLPGVAAAVVGILFAPKIAQSIRPATLIAAGLCLAIAGMVLVIVAVSGLGLPIVILGFVMFNLGCSPMVTLGTGIMLGFVAPERAGAAAALQETSSELGFSLGIAAMGSLATVIYRSVLSGGLPADLTVDQQKAALETLAGAVDLAGKVEQGSALLASARDAFIASLRAVAGVEAGILLLVAIIAIVALRQVRPLGQGQAAGHAEAALPQAAE